MFSSLMTKMFSSLILKVDVSILTDQLRLSIVDMQAGNTTLPSQCYLVIEKYSLLRFCQCSFKNKMILKTILYSFFFSFWKNSTLFEVSHFIGRSWEWVLMFNAHMDSVHGHQINYIPEIYRDGDDGCQGGASIP